MSAMAIRNSKVPQFRIAGLQAKKRKLVGCLSCRQFDYALFVLLSGDLSRVIAKK
jgi:hypothetical protein